jgi:hypothetical protein
MGGAFEDLKFVKACKIISHKVDKEKYKMVFYLKNM